MPLPRIFHPLRQFLLFLCLNCPDALISGLYPLLLYSLMSLQSRHNTARRCVTAPSKITVFNVPFFCWRSCGVVLVSNSFLVFEPISSFLFGVHCGPPYWSGLSQTYYLIPFPPQAFSSSSLGSEQLSALCPFSPDQSYSSFEAQLKAQQLHSLSKHSSNSCCLHSAHVALYHHRI